jgi:hypothetical protein
MLDVQLFRKDTRALFEKKVSVLILKLDVGGIILAKEQVCRAFLHEVIQMFVCMQQIVNLVCNSFAIDVLKLWNSYLT